MVSPSFQDCFLVALYLPLDWTPGWGIQLYTMGERSHKASVSLSELSLAEASFELRQETEATRTYASTP